MKNNIAISRQTYGKALNDWTKVHSRIRIVYPWRSNLIKRAARNRRKKPTLNVFACIHECGCMCVFSVDLSTSTIKKNIFHISSYSMVQLVEKHIVVVFLNFFLTKGLYLKHLLSRHFVWVLTLFVHLVEKRLLL